MDDIRKRFDDVDKDGNGKIDLIEFRALLSELEPELDAGGVEAGFDDIDADESGLIDFDEFSKWWSARA